MTERFGARPHRHATENGGSAADSQAWWAEHVIGVDDGRPSIFPTSVSAYMARSVSGPKNGPFWNGSRARRSAGVLRSSTVLRRKEGARSRVSSKTNGYPKKMGWDETRGREPPAMALSL